MRVAVVGSGIAGLTSAHYLQRKHEVTLFESENRPGGHTHTVELQRTQAKPLPVDTGFIVFNERTYPNFMELLRELGVDWVKSDMGFSVRSEKRNFEYAGKNLRSLYGQPVNLLRPSFHRMVLEILRFYREAKELLDSNSEEPLGDYLRRKKYSKEFARDHLYPMVQAVWSSSREGADRFSARFLVRFFDNHGFLQVENRPQWLTIPGGSRRYIQAILKGFKGVFRMNQPVTRMLRGRGGVEVHSEGASPETFDHVVVACHSDQALALLDQPTAVERDILSRLPYQSNEAVLHTDDSLMPRRKYLWSAWNVHLDQASDPQAPAALTYWMNKLQPLDTSENYFVTLNAAAQVAPDKVLRRIPYHHPRFTLEGVAAQSRRGEMIDHQGISYAGAYWRNGFHEDGVVSALAVCRALGVEP